MEGESINDQEPSWAQFFLMIREQFPYSKMIGARIAGGTLVSYERIQFTAILAPGQEPPDDVLPDDFDSQWKRLRKFCQVLQACVIAEIHFTRARPVKMLFKKSGGDIGESANRIRFPQLQGRVKEADLLAV
ncbi:MAG: hypothetical protein ACYCPQ_10535 [Elusimicrobiota bacterium]